MWLASFGRKFYNLYSVPCALWECPTNIQPDAGNFKEIICIQAEDLRSINSWKFFEVFTVLAHLYINHLRRLHIYSLNICHKLRFSPLNFILMALKLCKICVLTRFFVVD